MMQEIKPGIWRSKLPLARDVAEFARRGGRTVVDLTQRPRGTVERACAKHGLSYIKHPMPYDGGDTAAAAATVPAQQRPVLFHCFHGRDRTGRVSSAITSEPC